jgi:hypothetical protein
MVLGIIVYFAYGRSHSRLGRRERDVHGLVRDEIRATYDATRSETARVGNDVPDGATGRPPAD